MKLSKLNEVVRMAKTLDTYAKEHKEVYCGPDPTQLHDITPAQMEVLFDDLVNHFIQASGG